MLESNNCNTRVNHLLDAGDLLAATFLAAGLAAGLAALFLVAAFFWAAFGFLTALVILLAPAAFFGAAALDAIKKLLINI
jgi:hypothetical protein